MGPPGETRCNYDEEVWGRYLPPIEFGDPQMTTLQSDYFTSMIPREFTIRFIIKRRQQILLQCPIRYKDGNKTLPRYDPIFKPDLIILPAPFGVRRRRVTILLPRQPIPHGQPYRYHPNGLVHIARKRVGHRLVVRHSVDYSSSDYFNSDDSSRDSPSDSSSETPSDSSSDALSDSSSGHSSSDHSSPALPSGMRSSHQLCSSVSSIPYSFDAIIERPSHSSSVGPSRKRSRSPTTSVPISSPVPRALSFVRADLLPPRKRIRSSDSATDLEDCMGESSESFVPRGTSLRDEVVVRGSDEPYSEPDIDLEIQAMINECIAYADAFRAEGIDARVMVETATREEVEASARGMVEVRVDRVTHPIVLDDDPAQEEGAIEVAHETL
ncbi:hypothetical protein Tco_0200613 [Tanacetum coccineum]